MQSPISGLTTVTVTTDSFLKKNTHHLILYSLRPLPRKKRISELDRKFAAAMVYIVLYPGKGNIMAEINGEINCYTHEQYVNTRLVGDNNTGCITNHPTDNQ